MEKDLVKLYDFYKEVLGNYAPNEAIASLVLAHKVSELVQTIKDGLTVKQRFEVASEVSKAT